MKIQSSAVSSISQQMNSTQRVKPEEAFQSALTRAKITPKNSNTEQAADLTHMTPMRMREWINEQIRAGNMTLDESTPFVGMTIGAEVDNSPVNYLQKIKGGIDAAAWRGDSKEKAMWEMALAVAKRYQRQGVNIRTFA